MASLKTLQVGGEIHGFANGVFGRDSYSCRVIEAVGDDWIVTRDTHGLVEMVSTDLDRIIDPADLTYCGDGGECVFSDELDVMRAQLIQVVVEHDRD